MGTEPLPLLPAAVPDAGVGAGETAGGGGGESGEASKIDSDSDALFKSFETDRNTLSHSKLLARYYILYIVHIYFIIIIFLQKDIRYQIKIIISKIIISNKS